MCGVKLCTGVWSQIIQVCEDRLHTGVGGLTNYYKSTHIRGVTATASQSVCNFGVTIIRHQTCQH